MLPRSLFHAPPPSARRVDLAALRSLVDEVVEVVDRHRGKRSQEVDGLLDVVERLRGFVERIEVVEVVEAVEAAAVAVDEVVEAVEAVEAAVDGKGSGRVLDEVVEAVEAVVEAVDEVVDVVPPKAPRKPRARRPSPRRTVEGS